MNLKKFDNLTDLFFHQCNKQNQNDIFLEWLNTINRKKFTWLETKSCIFKVAKILREYIKDGDRVLLVSENRPEWLISDLAVMLSNAITVPAYTTYTENDYKYLIEDCEPSVVIVSNNAIIPIRKKLKNCVIPIIFFLSSLSANTPPYRLDGILTANSTNPKYAKVDPSPVSSYNQTPVMIIRRLIVNVAATPESHKSL